MNLRQSTTATRLVGPVLDSTGAIYSSAVIGDFNITKNGTTAAMASTATATHSHNGYYLIAFTTGNTGTVGGLEISCNKATYTMPVSRWDVLAGAVYDVLYGTTAPSTYAGGTVAGVTAKVAATIAAGDIAVDAVTASSLKADAVTKIQAGIATGTELATANAAIAALPVAILDLVDAIETDVTLRNALRIILAAAAGKVSGGGGSSISFRDVGDTKDRIIATVDAYGNRTTVTLDGA